MTSISRPATKRLAPFRAVIRDKQGVSPNGCYRAIRGFLLKPAVIGKGEAKTIKDIAGKTHSAVSASHNKPVRNDREQTVCTDNKAAALCAHGTCRVVLAHEGCPALRDTIKGTAFRMKPKAMLTKQDTRCTYVC